MPFGTATMGRCVTGSPCWCLAVLATACAAGRAGSTADDLLAAIFPPGQWSSEGSDVLRVIASSREEAPPACGPSP
jgi:hypothetical protein